MKKVIRYYIGDVKTGDGNYEPVLLYREETLQKRLLGWTMWIGNSFINRQDKTLTNYDSTKLEVRYKTTLFRTAKQAENFYKRHLRPKGIGEWKRA